MKKIKVLVVDDDDKILFAFNKLLEKRGYIYYNAKTGKEAIQKFSSEQPDIVFLDIGLPDYDGLEVLKKLRELNPSVPMIIISGRELIDHTINANQFEVFEYLTKPLSVIQIREAIDKVLLSLL